MDRDGVSVSTFQQKMSRQRCPVSHSFVKLYKDICIKYI